MHILADYVHFLGTLYMQIWAEYEFNSRKDFLKFAV